MKTSIFMAAAVAATLGAAGPASADQDYEFIGVHHFQSRTTQVVLDTVRTSQPGWVTAVEYRGGVPGRVLGSKPVHHGIHTNLHIPLRAGVQGDVMVNLYDSQGRAVTQEMIEMDR